MITRKEYITNGNNHHVYFMQFVDDRIKNIVKRYIGMDVIKNSKDEHFNDIPLKQWDSLPIAIDRQLLIETGEIYSLAVKVCIAKTAARELLREA